MILASLLHPEFNHRNIESYYFGCIIGAYGLFGMFSSFLAPVFIKSLGRSKVLYLGILLISMFFGFFGFVTLIESNKIMIVVAIALRALQGFARTVSGIP